MTIAIASTPLAEQVAAAILAEHGETAIKSALDLGKDVPWPENAAYRNSDTGQLYRPHHAQEAMAVFSDTPRHMLLKGGEGAGKTVATVIKVLERIRRGMDGVMCSPDLQHFKKSLWVEFRRWCPWECVIPRHRERYTTPGWEPQEAFPIIFFNQYGGLTTLYCGGAKEDSLETWEGPNISFAAGDEMKRHKTAGWLKTLTGRTRITGPLGEPPQCWISTTPKKHWLWEYFGPVRVRCPRCGEAEIDAAGGAPWACPVCQRGDDLEVTDEWADFKAEALVVTLKTADNEANLSEGFVRERRLTLTVKEALVYLDAAWEDLEAGERFLQSMLWWDRCAMELPTLGRRERAVVALDAATGRTESVSDCFGLLVLTARPEDTYSPQERAEKAKQGRHRKKDLAVRFAQAWQAKAGQKIDFQGTERRPGPERILRRLCKEFKVVCVVYDPTQLHDMATRLGRERVAWFQPFSQAARRIEADTDLLHMVQAGEIVHDGDETLRTHLDNADRKLDESGKRLRLVKRYETLPIDLAVCLSMGAHQARELNL